MLELKYNDICVCKTQMGIYSFMVKSGYNLERFSYEFLSCDFCNKEMDDYYSHFHTSFPQECADFFMPQIETNLFKEKGEYDLCAGVIGYIYRMLHIFTGIPSKELVSIVPFDEVGDEALTTIHYSCEDVTENIMQRHNLLLKRYDSDAPHLLDEEIEAIKLRAMLEREALERKYLK